MLLAVLFSLPLAAETQAPPEEQDFDGDEPSVAGGIDRDDFNAIGCGEDLAASCDGRGQCGGGPLCDHGVACYRPLIPRCGHFQFRAEYLLWWAQGADVPPLVTTSPPLTPLAQAGVLGQDTSILFGGAPLTDGARSGGRFAMTWWRQPNESAGLMVSYLRLEQESTPYSGASDGTSILARPFFNARTGAQDSRLIAHPNNFFGTVAVNATTVLRGWEALLRRALLQQPGFRTDLLFGYRYNRLGDNLTITDSSTAMQPPNFGTVVEVFDRFNTENRFHGAEVGVVFEKRARGWSWELLMKLGVGNTRSRVLIDGSTTTTVLNVAPVTTAGGLLAQPTNMGTYEHSSFSMIPELGVTIGYDLTRNLRATFGYTLLYWSKVARPGDQIDFDVNDTQFAGGALVGAPRPEFSWVTTDFWAQGLNAGLEYRF